MIEPRGDADRNDEHTQMQTEMDDQNGHASDDASARSDTDNTTTFLPHEDEAARVAHLTTDVRDQDDLEKDVGRQADEMLMKEADERDVKRLERSLQQKDRATKELRGLRRKLQGNATASATSRLQVDVELKQDAIASLDGAIEQIKQRIEDRRKDAETAENADADDQSSNHPRPGESKREFLIRTGKITPFSKVGQSLTRQSSNLAEAIIDAEESSEDDGEDVEGAKEAQGVTEPVSHRILMKPGFAEVATDSARSSPAGEVRPPPAKRRKSQRGPTAGQDDGSRPASSSGHASDDSFVDEAGVEQSDVESTDAESDGPGFMGETTDEQVLRASRKRSSGRISRNNDEAKEDMTDLDDGNEKIFQRRLEKWVSSRSAAREKARASQEDGDAERSVTAGADEWFQPHPTRPDGEYEGGFRVPGDIYSSLFDYQKTGVKWLWELHQQSVGGILGDEMGLGKTIQVISFLAGIHYTGRYSKPTIVVAPATLLKQWVNEFHRWWPAFRVSILHSSGSGMMDIRSESKLDEQLDLGRMPGSRSHAGKSSKAAKKIVDRVVNEGHVLITTYSGLQANANILIPVEWGYAVLDEGHKIRNPNTSITIYCKELRTPHRAILSGTPMQNNLIELWSLFDFVFPMRLGTLVNFRDHFDTPIRQGGYANASNLAVETAFNCAQALKGSISPYLMQRWKSDVASDLPTKSEQVLFCKLTKPQREAYQRFLTSSETEAIMEGKRQALYGIDILRKICNHPDLTGHKTLSIKEGYNYGAGNKSGKMQVVKALLQLWKDTGHKTLLFAQHRIMLDILERFIKRMDGVGYRRMDGNTPIKDRQNMVDEFNRDPEIHVFLLTTKVGGLGVNLTGADRVIIYDPDWNPSTDVQARERAWRLGQKREVLIYRLMSAGTIEEKIYHRQLFKQFLTNKVLKDPKQRAGFHFRGLKDLFTLGNADDEETETGGLFKGSETRIEASEEDSRISEVVGLSHRAAFQDDKNQSSAPSTRAGSPNNKSGVDTTAPHLMEALLGRSGVHASLSHDTIVGGAATGRAGKITTDPASVSAEASRIAARHAAELQRAGEAARDVPIGVLTWTGMVGEAGRPEPPRPRVARGGIRGGGSRGGRGGVNGPSSSAVLANLASRQGQTTNGNISTAAEAEMDFFESIPNFFHAHGGKVYSRMLVDHFNRLCNTPEKSREFKDKLRRVAVVGRSENSGHSSSIESTGARGRAVMRGGRMRLANGRAPAVNENEGRTKWVLKKEFGGIGV